MAISRLELARAFRSDLRAEEAAGRRPVASATMGTARTDSAAGVVYVDVGGDVVSGDGSQGVPVATSQDVREGDRVIVSLYGPDGASKTPIVTGVIGGGDRTRDELAAKVESESYEFVQTDSPTTPPGDDAAWSESAPSWVDGKYMWMRTSTTRGGSTTHAAPVCITGARGERGIPGTPGDPGAPGKDGTPGKDGAPGESAYVHVKYSPVADPTDSQITETPDVYIGWCTSHDPKDPASASSYTWSRFRGEDGSDGIPGAPGADGKTSYVHFAYSTSGDGRSNFSTTAFEGATHLGTRTDFDPLDSTNPSDYGWSEIRGAKGDPGAPGKDGTPGKDGAPGADGKDGRMLVASSSTAQDVAAKVATLQAGSIELSAGASVSVVFSAANVAASPTLAVRSADGSSTTPAKPIMTNGTDYAYWVAGTAVAFVYDGSSWQVCSAPVYASRVTVGNPSGNNVYVDSDAVYVRDALEVLASFSKTVIELGKNSSEAVIKFCDDLGEVCQRIINGNTYLTMQSANAAVLARTIAALRVQQDGGQVTDDDGTTRDVTLDLADVSCGKDGSSSYISMHASHYTDGVQDINGNFSIGAGKGYGSSRVVDGPYVSISAIDTRTSHVRYDTCSLYRALDSLMLGEEIWVNAESNFGGGITGMSRSAADLVAMLIVYQDNDGTYYSQYVPDPDGKTVGLWGFQRNSTALYLKCLKVRISGTDITTEAGWGGEYALGASSGTGNVLRIVRVLGWEN